MRSFKVYGKWSVQANKQANIHTHVCNEVTLVWGSLRLAPTSFFTCNVVENIAAGLNTYNSLDL